MRTKRLAKDIARGGVERQSQKASAQTTDNQIRLAARFVHQDNRAFVLLEVQGLRQSGNQCNRPRVTKSAGGIARWPPLQQAFFQAHLPTVHERRACGIAGLRLANRAPKSASTMPCKAIATSDAQASSTGSITKDCPVRHAVRTRARSHGAVSASTSSA